MTTADVQLLLDAATTVRRSDPGRLGDALGAFLDSHARDLDMALGVATSTDSPGDLEHALNIARAILGEPT